jgi:hypothetical protein
VLSSAVDRGFEPQSGQTKDIQWCHEWLVICQNVFFVFVFLEISSSSYCSFGVKQQSLTSLLIYQTLFLVEESVFKLIQQKNYRVSISMTKIVHVVKGEQLSFCDKVYANSAIFQLYYGEKKLIINEMMMRSALF